MYYDLSSILHLQNSSFKILKLPYLDTNPNHIIWEKQEIVQNINQPHILTNLIKVVCIVLCSFISYKVSQELRHIDFCLYK